MKNYFWLILFLFVSNTSISQVDSLKYYFEKNDFNKTIIYGEKLLEGFNENYFPKNQKYVYTLDYLLLSYQNNQSFDKDAGGETTFLEIGNPNSTFTYTGASTHHISIPTVDLKEIILSWIEFLTINGIVK